MKTVLSGEPITGAQLKQFGFDVVPANEFEQAVLKMAQTISNRSISSLITAKKAINASI
jgi:enoyl-CoA hydratase/carnithine racemase